MNLQETLEKITEIPNNSNNGNENNGNLENTGLESLASYRDNSNNGNGVVVTSSYERGLEDRLKKKFCNILYDIRDYILYNKKSLGKGGKPVNLWKFRSMIQNADKHLDRAAKNGYDGYGNPIKDPRITFIGRIIRPTKIDELPQIWNLLRGELKLVGYAPMGEDDWKIYPGDTKERALKYKPGLIRFQYAILKKDRGNFDDHVKNLNEYLEKCDRNLKKADGEYLLRFLRNVPIFIAFGMYKMAGKCASGISRHVSRYGEMKSDKV